VQIGAILFMALGIALAGVWSDKTTPRIVLMGGGVLAILCGVLLAPMMQAGSLMMVFGFLALALFVMGLVYGPLGAFLPHLFPARVRYTGASAAFNVGGVIGGGFTPAIALALAKQYGGLTPVGWCLGAAALLSLIALIPLKREEP
jgi:MFS family permease